MRHVFSTGFIHHGNITTNLTPKELIGRYQQRVMTRVKEMTIPIAFTGRSKRGTTVQELF